METPHQLLPLRRAPLTSDFKCWDVLHCIGTNSATYKACVSLPGRQLQSWICVPCSSPPFQPQTCFFQTSLCLSGHVEWVYSPTLLCSRSWVHPLLFHLPVTSTSAFFCCNFETHREPWVCRGSNTIFTADIPQEIDPVPSPQVPQPLSSPERDAMYTCLNFNPWSIARLIGLVIVWFHR